MAVRFRVAAGVLAAIMLLGCGSSGQRTAGAGTAGEAAGASPPAGAQPSSRGVRGRVLEAGELAGYTPGGQPTLGIDAASWVHEEEIPGSQRARETARLERLGFLAGLRERLHPAGGDRGEGSSIVEQFGSPRGARSELAAGVQQLDASGRPFTTFAVPGVPGARGFAQAGAESSGLNVAFTKGPYFYVVGAGGPQGSSAKATPAIVIAAAQRLYGRVQP